MKNIFHSGSFFHVKGIRKMMWLVLGLFIVQTGYSQQAVLKEEEQIIKTYPFSDPNPLPAMAISKKFSFFYPYFFIDGYTRKGTDEKWKVITLENDFIKVLILPGVGGKVWGAIEKSTGKDFIYLNHVLKFRSIGIRGPWTSGGIEHNFGLDLGHAPWTAADVDYLVRKNPDGSVSCFVGGTDLASRTEWRVEVRLPKDKAYFETNSMWYNPSPLHGAYLSWENAAYKAADDLQFFFPGTHYLGHGGDVHAWPFNNEGRNLSLYKENNFGSHKSYHVVGRFTDWFGGYYHNSGFGTGHWVSYDDAPGKKIWIWSLARSGAIWKDLLTDTDGQYIEAQSGVKFNQASAESGYHTPFDQLSLKPFYTETKSEVWFPVLGTGGMVKAGREGTLNLVELEDGLKLSYCPNVAVADSLTVFMDGKIIYQEYLKLKPMELWEKHLILQSPGGGRTDIKIGGHMLQYSSDPGKDKIERPLVTPSGQSYNSAEQLFRVAEDMYSMRDYGAALKTYLECVEKEPTHSRALTKIAELYYRRALYQEALEYAKRVLENNTYDGGANFIYAAVQNKLGKQLQAEEAYSVAVRSMEFRSAAYVQIAGLNLSKKNYNKAITYARKALDFNRYNITAYEFLSMAYRKLNMGKMSENILDDLSDIDPLNHFARYERYLLNPSESTRSAFNSVITNEFPHETYLEIAMIYANHGLEEEAISVLEQSPEYPTVCYWLAYLYRLRSPEKSKSYLEKAVNMSPVRVFPFRTEIIPVLHWAQQKLPGWKNQYYLGLVYWYIHRIGKAKEYFKRCGNAPDYAPFYIARGELFKDDEKHSDLILSDFKRALTIDPDEWRSWFYLTGYLESRGQYTEQLEYSGKAWSRFQDKPEIGIDYAKALVNNSKFKAALKVLQKIDVLPYEGAREGYNLYEAANLLIAVDLIKKGDYKKAISYVERSEMYPENLGTGKPYEPDVRLQDYMIAHCYSASGKPDSAARYYRKIYKYSEKQWSGNGQAANIYPAIQTYRLLGKEKNLIQAMKLWKVRQDSLRNWRISRGSSSPQVQWLLAEYDHDEAKAKELEDRSKDGLIYDKMRILWSLLSIIGG